MGGTDKKGQLAYDKIYYRFQGMCKEVRENSIHTKHDNSKANRFFMSRIDFLFSISYEK